MANENQVVIEVKVDAKDAQAAIELFGAQSVKSIKKAESAAEGFTSKFKTLFAPIAAGAAALAGSIRLISEAIDGAVEDQKLFLQIGAALKTTGDFSEEAAQSIVEFADAIKDATGVGDELAKQIFIDAKAFGISTEQAKKLTQASIDYAAATGIDAVTAATRLGQTLDGTVGKIGNLGADFRNLTEEQLKNGAAVDLVSKKYAGAAAEQFNTFQGAANSLSNALGDLLKAFGKIITESPAIIKAISLIAEAINFTATTVSNLARGPMRDYQDQLDLVKATKFVAQNELVGNSSKIVGEQFKELFTQTEKTQSSYEKFATFGEKLASTELGEKKIALTGKALQEFEKQAADALNSYNKFSSGLLLELASDSEKIRIKTKSTLDTLNKEALAAGKQNSQEVTALKLRIAEKEAEDLSKIAADAREKDYALAKKAAQDFNKEMADIATKEQEQRSRVASAGSDPITALGRDNRSEAENAAIGVGITSLILKGQQGAEQVITKGLGLFADTILPGIGGAVAGLAELLSRGPEATKEFIREFVKAIPDIIEAISESIPVVVETFVDTMVNRGGAARIAVAIGKALLLQPVWANIGAKISDGFKMINFSGITDAVIAGLSGFKESLSQLFSNITNGLSSAFTNLFQPLTDAIRPLTDAITKLFAPIQDLIAALKGGKGGGSGLINEFLGGKGGGQGVIAEQGKRLGKAIGLAKGGTVYAAGGFSPRGTDTVPAMLTPGEMVVPKDMVGQLGAYLMRQQSPSGGDASMLAQILSAVNQPMVVQAEAKVNQSAFADVILQLNRQNARLSA